jgi:hypothetical protein
MSIDSELRRVSASTREAVASGLDVDARLDELKVVSRRRRGRRGVAGLVATAAAVVTVAGLVPLGVPHDSSPSEPDLGRTAVTCADALAGTVSPGGAVQCLAPRLVLVQGPVDYTFRLTLGVPWKVGPWGAPASLSVIVDRADAPAGVDVFADVRAAAGEGGRELSATELASWVATRPFLESTPMISGRQDGLPTWTVEVRPRTDLPRPGPARACNGVNTNCHRLLLWRQGASGNEAGIWDGEVSRWTFLDVPGRGVVALVTWAKQGDRELLDEGTALLHTVDFVLPVD